MYTIIAPIEITGENVMHINKVFIGIIVVLSMLLFSSCANNETGSNVNSSSTEQSDKSKTSGENQVMDASEFTFYPSSDGKTCSIMRGDDQPKHEIMKIPEKNESRTVVEIESEGFKLVEVFNSLIIPDTVKKIGATAFAFCPDLKTLDMGNGVEQLGQNTFIGCKKLKTVTLSNKLTEIPMGAFQNCAIETVYIPSSVQSIKENAFAICESLKEVHIPSSVKKIADTNGPFEDSPNVTIYAPSGSYAEKYAKSKNIPFVAE